MTKVTGVLAKINKERLGSRVGKLNENYMNKVDFALSVTFGLVNSGIKN